MATGLTRRRAGMLAFAVGGLPAVTKAIAQDANYTWRNVVVGAGGFIPGIRAGKPTEEYLAYVLSRLTAPGSLYLAVISLIPAIAFIFFNAQNNFPFGGTSILIVVGVGLDTVKQIESQLQQRNYEGFLR